MLVYKKIKNTIYINDIVIPVLCIVFVFVLVIFPDISVSSALKGINLWFNIVFPSLFPFFVASELINSTGFVRVAGRLLEPIMRPVFNVPGCGSFALLMGISSGYPVGAKITCSLLESGDISKNEAERLLAFTNNSGPLFIIGAVATGMYGIPALGYLLLTCHIAASITVGLLFRFRGKHSIRKTDLSDIKIQKNVKKKHQSEIASSNNMGAILGEAVKNSIYLVINIGAFIIFFSVVINLLLKTGLVDFFSGAFAYILSPMGLNADILSAILSGLFEITTGTNLASKVNSIPMSQQLIFTSFIIGWAGLSVHSQVYSIVGKSGISLRPYILGKFIQGIIAAIFTMIGLQFDFIKVLMNQPVLNAGQAFSNIRWQNVLITSGKYLLFVLIIYALFCFVALIFKHPKHNKP